MQSHNLEMLQTVALGLAELKEQVVFVGGTVTELYASHRGAAPVRPTLDVDLIINIVSKSEFAEMEHQLRELGFTHDFSEGAPICRWLYQGIKVDLMPTETRVLGFSNEWYPVGYQRRIQVALSGVGYIYILPPAIYLCTKLSATQSRGYPDLIMSHDFEDLVYLMSNCEVLLADLEQSDVSVKKFVSETLRQFQVNPKFEEAIVYSLPYGEADRLDGIQQKIMQMILMAGPLEEEI